jgi:hypothetical protein
MGTTLTGQRIKDSYAGIVKTEDDAAFTASTPTALSDGYGNVCPISVAQDSVEINGGSLKIGDELLDGAGNVGSDGNVLVSTGTGVEWQIPYAYNVTHHNFDITGFGNYYLPINSLTETVSLDTQNIIIPPYSGDVVKVIIKAENSVDTNGLYMYNGATEIGNNTDFDLVADTALVVALTSGTFVVGDSINFKLVSAGNLGKLRVSIVWKYNVPV